MTVWLSSKKWIFSKVGSEAHIFVEDISKGVNVSKINNGQF